jgi:FkbM family methyltransferase
MGFYHFLRTESWLGEIINVLFQIKQGAFFDVGANIGQTLLKVKNSNLEVNYYGFEPNSGAYFYLTELIRVNGYKNCRAFPFALSDQNGITGFFHRHRSDVSSTIIKEYKSFATQDKMTLVASIKGDDIFEQLGQPVIAILKIDVEGAELEVLKGFSKTLLLHKPFIICEILPVYHLSSERLAHRQERQQNLIEKLTELDYLLFRIINGQELQIINEIEIHGDLKKTNYIGVPKEFIKSIGQTFLINNEIHTNDELLISMQTLSTTNENSTKTDI